VPELKEDASAALMDAIGDLAPACDLFPAVDAGGVLVSLACCETWLASVINSPAEARWP
jgi:hypothetical protein